MIKTKQILIALAVIGANVLHNMPVHTALAAEGDIWWYGTMGGFVDIKPVPAVTTDVNLTITDSTQVNGKTVAVVNNIYGGYTSGSEAVKNNSITFNTTDTTTIVAFIYGADTDSGDASGNSVNIKNGTFSRDIYGSRIHNISTTGTATKNSVNIADGTFSGKIFGGYNYASTATKNSVVIDGGTFSGGIYGAQGRGVDGNSVTINNGTFKTDVFGGNATSDGTATNNTVTINNGVFDVNNKYVYGGVSAGGDVTGNKVIINDGQFTGTNIWAGKAMGNPSGNATKNIVTIKGGTFNNLIICGGISNKSDAKDNIVNIEGGTFNGTSMKFYGGYAPNGTSSNNTLNLKTAIAGTAKEVKYFQNINFTLPVGATSEVTMLKMEDTKTMSLADITFTTDLNGLGLTGNDYVTLVRGVDGTAGALDGQENYYVLDVGEVMELVYSNGTPVAKGDYTIKQGSNKFDSETIGNYTVQINGNTTDGGLSATSYSGNEVIIRRGMYAPDIGNIAVAGAYNTTTDDAINNNTVKIYDGTFKGNIYGGHSTNGEVSGNRVNIYGGTLGESNPINIYGGDSISGNATGNVTNIEGGIFAVKAFIRGGASNDGSVTGNKLNIENGTFSVDGNEFYGGYSNSGVVGGVEPEKGNILSVRGGTFGDSSNFYGGWSTNGNTIGNIVTISNGSFGESSKIYGGYSKAENGMVGGDSEDKGNKVVIDNATFNSGTSNEVYGGYAENPGGIAKYNSVTINDGTFMNPGSGDFRLAVAGGYAARTAQYNAVTINGGTFSASAARTIQIIGGYSGSSDASHNTVAIKNGTFGANTLTYGGCSEDANVTSNVVEISDGEFGDNANIYGGYSGGGNATDNTVAIIGGNFTDNYKLYGGYTTSGTSTNNTLNLKTKMGGTAAEVKYFQNVNFTLPTDIADEDTMLSTATMAFDGTKITIDVDPSGEFTIAEGTVINLIDASGGMTGTYSVDKIFGVDATEDSGVYSTDIAKVVKSDNVISLTMLGKYAQDVWYSIGSEKKILSSTASAQTISGAEGDVVLYHGAGENNEYGAITTTKSVTVGAETEIGKSFLISGDLTAANGVTVAAKNTLNIAAGNLKSSIANSGTVVLKEGTLAAGSTITGGTVNITGDVTANASDIAGDANTIDADKTLTLNGGTLGGNLSGAGKVTIGNGTDNAAVTAALTKFGNTVDLTVAANGTLMTGGELNRGIKGTGTVQLNADSTLSNGKKIDGTLDGNGKNVTIGTANSIDSFTVGKLAGTTNLTLDVDMGNFTADKIVATDFDGTVVVNGINIIKDYAEGASELALPKASTSADEITYLGKSGGNGTTSVKDGQIVVTNKYKYTFTAGGVGKLAYRVDASDLTFKKFVEGTLDSPSPTTLSLTEDLLNLGDGIDSISQGPNSITINLNGHNLSSASASNIIIGSGKTLNLNGDGTVDGNTNFSVDGDMNINGTTTINGNIANTGTVTFAGTTTAAGSLGGAGAYNNSGTLNIADASKLQMTGTNGLTNTGILKLGGGTLGADITGDGITNILGEVTSARNITNSVEVASTGDFTVSGGNVIGKVTNRGNFDVSGGMVAMVDNKGTMTVTGLESVTGEITNSGTLNLGGGTLGADITGAGTTNILGNVTSAKDIENKVAVVADASLTNSGNVYGPVENNGTFDNSNGTLGGKVTNSGTLTTKLEKISNWDSGNVTNSGTLNIIGGGELEGQNITNTNGTINLSGDYTLDWANAASGLVIDGGSVDVSDSTLTLTGLTKENKNKKVKLLNLTNGATATGSWSGLQEGVVYNVKMDGTGIFDADNRLKTFKIEDGYFCVLAYGANFVPPDSQEDGIRTSAYHVANAMAESADSNVTNFIDGITNMADTGAAADTLNASMNIGEAGGVQHGAVSMVGYIGEAIGSNLSIIYRPILGENTRAAIRNVANEGDTKKARIEEIEVGKANEIMPVAHQEQKYEKIVWASYMHNKEDINGLRLDGVKQNGTAQYNGTTVGADLWSSNKVVGGVAIAYTTGDVNSVIRQAATKNEVKYYGVSVYNRWTNGSTGILADVGYMHSKNELTQHNAGDSELTADAKINSFTAGVRAEQLVKMGRSNLVPFAGVRYMHLRNGEYTLRAKGSDIQHFAPKNQNIITPQVGVGWNGEYKIEGSKWTFRPSAEVGYLWNLGDRDTESIVSFGGANDTIGYEVADKSSYYAKLGVEFKKDNVILGVSFKYQKGDAVKNRKWNVNLNFSF